MRPRRVQPLPLSTPHIHQTIMRLIHAPTLTLVEFFEPTIPEYSILSHTWEDGEVSFQEMGLPSARQDKQGFIKITGACDTALSLGLEYIWVDTCCIDKTSSAELTESINSMFAWYLKSRICIVFLADYGADQKAPLGPCRWFSRGWTLQELIAPKCINFYNSAWELIGTKQNLATRLSEATKIPTDAIAGLLPLDHFSVAQRMSWAAGRKTTRVEDRAYSLLGLFDISMPMLYGEGTKAFRRLQEEIIKRTNDLTILGWRPDESGNSSDDEDSDNDSVLRALAVDPDAFSSSHNLQRSRIFEMPTSHTNMGLQLVQRRLFLLPRYISSVLRRLAPGVEENEDGYLYLLEVGRDDYGDLYVCIPIRQVGFGTYFRERRPSVVKFDEIERDCLDLTSPHKFLLATTLSPGIPTSISQLYRSSEPLHGAIYIGAPRLLSANHSRFEFVQQSPTPEAAYDHATGLAFLPQGIGLEVFACEYRFVDAVSGLFVHIGVLLASKFAPRVKHLPQQLAIVNLSLERFQIIFALLRRNPEEPMKWAHVLQLLGPEGGDNLLIFENEERDACLSVSADAERRTVQMGGESFLLPCLQLSASLLVKPRSSTSGSAGENSGGI
ncbi:heterokaryon incompatibility protein-domain-containing protein [Schizothecium vesticola]|uniref:Heterokaryon incompatibility protein-domain-containing protein n=1 Tax=Schizothecium vesticola TaxID=314040 RepID=A0AA40K1X2_9PEZI|nr:heterokaryon incompatibility protein-domain-containing protein [Schizothecium vesticola]